MLHSRMPRPPYSSLVLKVGSNVITDEHGLIYRHTVSNIVAQIAQMKSKKTNVILVSSGAMAAGCAALGIKKPPQQVVDRQVLAAVGQVKLMDIYNELFKEHSFTCAQVLLTKENFRTRDQYRNIQNCFSELLEQNIIPIVNENDVVSVHEMMFSDNDEVAGLIAAMMNSDALILLSGVDGVYDGDPTDTNSSIIRTIEPGDTAFQDFLRKDMSKFGRGGMRAKCALAGKLAMMGIPVHILNGKTENSIETLLRKEDIGTTFLPAKKTSGSKRWVGMCDGQEKGTVYVNRGAADALMNEKKANSLLPIGINCILGDFVKGDIIRICDEDAVELGLGMAQYDSDTARSTIGKKEQKPLIHYDYLFLEG